MLIIIGLVAAGMLLGYFVFAPRKSGRPLRVVNRIQQLATIVLLFAMGVWLGGNESFWNNIATIGVSGLLLAAGVIAGSAAFVKLFDVLAWGRRRAK